jgi:transposase
VLTTNDDPLSAAAIALGYKGMGIIEACFRKLKTTGLGIRPMFHWTPRRIVAHVTLCVLALIIQRAAEIAAAAPWSQLADLLDRLKAVRYTAEGETIVQASRIGPELAAILKTLDITKPKPILAVGCSRQHRFQR